VDRTDADARAARLADIEAELAGIETALGRLDDGTYGRCSGCDATLDDAWLEQHPATTTCPGCSATRSA